VYGQESLREPDSADRQRAGGELDVRVVRTYPNYRKRHWGDQLIQPPFQTGYRFAPDGEMGIFNALVKAIGETKRSIYLEDQYLVNSASLRGAPPITEYLRKAIEQPTFQQMVIAVAGTGTVQGELYQAGTRRAEFMRQLGPQAAQKVAVYVYKGDDNSPYWFHSKTWIFDDEFAVIASANCNRRSYSCDSEIGICVADRPSSNGRINFAHRLRMDLWLKHLNTRPKDDKQSSTALSDDDVKNFVAAAKLWASAPLLQAVNFDVNPERDGSIGERFFSQYPKTSELLKKSPLGGTVSPYVGDKDFEWSLIDPDGS
jgi:phosphatidylserine/phosphatidylglycerophosphate/cardiolipin synthase-like enzyme